MNCKAVDSLIQMLSNSLDSLGIELAVLLGGAVLILWGLSRL